MPSGSRWRTWRRNRRPAAPDWMPDLRARITWIHGWDPARLPDGDALVATAWQTAEAVAAAPGRCGAKAYLVQHYESLYHGEAARVDATYRLPMRKIFISTWLADIMREKFGAVAEVIVTPVDPALFHPCRPSVDGRLRVLMLHHEYAWKGVADGLEAVGRVRAAASRALSRGLRGRSRRERGVPTTNSTRTCPRTGSRGSTAAAPSISARPGTRGWACRPWKRWPAVPRSPPMTTAAAATTRATARRRWWHRAGTWRPSRTRSGASSRIRPCVRAWRGRGRPSSATRFDWDRATTRLETLLAAR